MSITFFSAGCDGGNSCCRAENPCFENEGDCDEDEDCFGELICGQGSGKDDNCPSTATFQSTDDCCYRGKNHGLSFLELWMNERIDSCYNYHHM